MATYACERTFSPPLTVDQFKAASQTLRPCITARDIQWLGSTLSTDGARCICMFEAADAERIREANHLAGVPFDKIYAVDVYKP